MVLSSILLASPFELFQPQPSDLPLFVELDQLCLGGMWSLSGYEREWESPNGFLFGLRHRPTANPTQTNSPQCSSPPLVGMGAYWQILEEAHITLLAVHPLFRQQGLGRELLKALLSSAQQQQLERATLEVKAGNTSALNLYAHFGFKVAGKRKKYYPDNEDAIILWLKDLQHQRD